jgi:hypothetical protein
LPLIECDDIGFLEITKTPQSYLTQHDQKHTNPKTHENIDKTSIQFERFLGAILHSSYELGFRIQSINGHNALYYLTKQNKTEFLSSAFTAQFSGFELQTKQNGLSYQIDSPVHIAEIIGVPNLTSHTLDGLAESFSQSKSSTLYQVWVTSRKPQYFARKITEQKYRSALQRSQTQQSLDSWMKGQETRTKYDVKALRSSKWHEAAFERICAERLLETRVIIAAWGHDYSEISMRTALNTLLGTISHSGRKEKLRVQIYSGKRAFLRLSDALTMGKKANGTLLLPRDAVPYFDIPHIELGLTQSFIAPFATSDTTNITGLQQDQNFRQGYITLGQIYRGGALKSDQLVYIRLEDLRRHTTILGMTGSGKSSTKNRIVIDAWKNGIPSLLLEPVKSDSRSLLAAIPEARIFTVGREPVAPYRLNPFLVERGVPVQAHIDQLYFAFLAAWPLYGILANHLRKVIVRTYMRKGWNLLTDVCGRQISLQDFRDEAERYTNELQYGSELKQDFRGAILTRVEDLCDPSRAAVFNTLSNLSFGEFLRVPTIIELRPIKDPEFRALIVNLILHRVEQYFEKLGPAEGLRSLIIIDEAHRFLRELPPTLDMSEAAVSKRQVLDQIEDLTAEARSYGVGMIVLDQAPSQLSRGVLKNCHTKIVHRLESPDDCQLAAYLTGCNREQQAHMTMMKEGEAVIKGIRDSVPRNIQILYDPDFTHGMKTNWTDDEVIQRMKKFYLEHPEFAITPEIPSLDSSEVIEDRELISLRVQVEDIVGSHGYRKNYTECMKKSNAEELCAIEELIVYYATNAVNSDKPFQDVVRVFIDVTEAIHGPTPYKLNQGHIQQLILNSQQSQPSVSGGGDSDGP